MAKPQSVEVGQRWVHAGTPGAVHVVVKIDEEGWAVFPDGYGCCPAATLLDSDRWYLLIWYDD